jgi:6-phosphofructokinase 1
MIFFLGGDGTHRGIKVIQDETNRRKLKCTMVGIPKTIDNDIPILDRSFGFETAVEEAQRAIASADVEANSVDQGIGLVKLMGRNSGFIAMHASLANRGVNLCMIPEAEYTLEGETGYYEWIRKRLEHKRHCVVVVAEGAAAGCQDKADEMQQSGTDPSGNPILFDIGHYLQQEIPKYLKSKGLSPTLKYIDPTYMIRTVPANASDRVLCSSLAHNAVHGAMAGFTGFSVGEVSGRDVYIPIDLLVNFEEGKNPKPGQRRVNTETDRKWWRLMANTGQPICRGQGN